MPELPEVYPTDVPPDPPDAPPYRWEDHSVFRASFLMYFTRDGDREALEQVGRAVYDLVLEMKGWPGWKESATRTEMRSIAEDLRHAESFLWSVGQEKRVASLDSEDVRLAFMAETWSQMVGRIAHGIEMIVGPLPGQRFEV